MIHKETGAHISELFLLLKKETDKRVKKELAEQLMAELGSLYLSDEALYQKWRHIINAKNSEDIVANMSFEKDIKLE